MSQIQIKALLKTNFPKFNDAKVYWEVEGSNSFMMNLLMKKWWAFERKIMGLEG